MEKSREPVEEEKSRWRKESGREVKKSGEYGRINRKWMRRRWKNGKVKETKWKKGIRKVEKVSGRKKWEKWKSKWKRGIEVRTKQWRKTSGRN